MKGPLILSIFPGIDLFGLAFQQEWPEACIVRGPDPIFGSLHDIRNFHPPAGVFDGVIGGPPCQIFSRLRFLNPHAGERHGNLIPEFCRIIRETDPPWWVMENVKEAPEPEIEGYQVQHLVLNNRWFGEEQHRVRRFSFGSKEGQILQLEVALFEAPLYEHAVTAGSQAVPVKLGGSRKVKSSLKPHAVFAGHGPYDRGPGTSSYPKRTIQQMCLLQGLPSNFADGLPFTSEGKRQVIGNAVPMPMGRALAKAIKQALEGGKTVRGITVIEVLIIIAILGILAVVIVPKVLGY